MFNLQEKITSYIVQFINNINANNKYLILNLHRNDLNCIVYVDACLYGLLGLGQKYRSEYKSLLSQLKNVLVNYNLDEYFTLIIRSENSFSIELNKNISHDSVNILISLIELQENN